MSNRQIRAGGAIVEIGAVKTRLEKGLKAAQHDLRNFGRSITAVGGMVAGAGVAMATPLGYATKVLAGFDDAIRATAAVSKSTAEQMQSLRGTALELGRTTSFTAAEVANLMTELGRAGFAPDQITNMTGAVLDLARATGTDATLASGIMAATIRQFGMEATDAARVADVLTAAANGSFNTVEQLGEALAFAGPVAADFGMTIEETSAILGTLGNVGIQASSAGTALRRLLTITGAEAERLQEIFGVSFVDASGNARPLVDTLGEVAEATNGLGTAARSQKFNEAFGLLGITGASAISKVTTETKALYQALTQAQGQAARTAQEMDAGIGGSFRKLSSAIEGTVLAIAESFAPQLQKVTDAITTSSGAVTAWVNENQKLVLALALAPPALVATGSAMISLGASAYVASTAIRVVGGSIALLTSPIGATIVALGALGYAVYASMGNAGKVTEWLKERFETLVDTVSESMATITSMITEGRWAEAWELTTDLMEMAWLDMTGGVRDAWGELMGYILDSGSVLADGIGATFRGLGDALESMINGYQSIYDAIYNKTEAALTGGINALTNVETIGGPASPQSAFDRDFGGVANSARDQIAKIKEFGQAMSDEAKAQVGERMQDREAAKQERQARLAELRQGIGFRNAAERIRNADFTSDAKTDAPKPDDSAINDAISKVAGAISADAEATVDAMSGGNGTTAGVSGTFSAFASALVGQIKDPNAKLEDATKKNTDATNELSKAFKDASDLVRQREEIQAQVESGAITPGEAQKKLAELQTQASQMQERNRETVSKVVQQAKPSVPMSRKERLQQRWQAMRENRTHALPSWATDSPQQSDPMFDSSIASLSAGLMDQTSKVEVSLDTSQSNATAAGATNNSDSEKLFESMDKNLHKIARGIASGVPTVLV